MAEDKDLLTVEEACERLNVGRTLLYGLLMSDPPEIESVNVGRLRRIPRTEIDRYIRSQMSKASGGRGRPRGSRRA